MQTYSNTRKQLIITMGILLFAVLIGMVTGCEKDAANDLPTEPVLIETTAHQQELIESGNQFGFELFAEIIAAEQDPDKNIMISPLSISYALSMAYNGAAGNTATEMAEMLGVENVSQEAVNEGFRKLTEDLMAVDQRVEMNIANSVWSEEEFPVKEEYIQLLTEYFLAQSHTFDITDPEAHVAVNEWIEEATRGKIKEMLGQLDPQTVMLLVNAVYFKAQWKTSFNEEETTDRTFYLADGTTIETPMMAQKEDLASYRHDRFTLVELPYGQGNYTFTALLPDEDQTTDSIMPLLTAKNFAEWTANTGHPVNTRLYLPRFSYGYKKELKSYLKTLGMQDAFDPSAADLSRMTDAAVFISFVLHQSFIEVNEEGTEAAAATVVGVELTSMPSEPNTINFNRPFLYFIRETTTNTILFAGRVNKPVMDD